MRPIIISLAFLCWAKLAVGDDVIHTKDGWYVPCDQKSCSDLDWQLPEKRGDSLVYVTSKAGDHFTRKPKSGTRFFTNSSNILRVTTDTEYQTILGWGGAFTDSTGLNLYKLSSDLQDRLLDSYFGPKGLRLNIGRVPMGGADFSTRPYSYDDSVVDDLDLQKWNLDDVDRQYKIPMLQSALQREPELKLFASPWSPPGWMKTSESIVRGHLKADDKYYAAYAKYFIKFFDTYKQYGIDFWGATVQNEPVTSQWPGYNFNCMQYTNDEMIKLIGRFLGPELERRGMTRDKFKLMIGDDNVNYLDQASAILDDPLASKYVSATAYHWYNRHLRPYSDLGDFYKKYQNKSDFLLMTEACTAGDNPRGPLLGSWQFGVDYAADMIQDVANYVTGWVDWNMALDMQGGPNWVQNYVDSPVLIDTKNNRFYKQPMYFVRAHFSLMRPGSVRVDHKLTPTNIKNQTEASNLFTVAALDKESGILIVNVLNGSPRDTTVAIEIDTLPGLSFEHNFEADSLTSIVTKV